MTQMCDSCASGECGWLPGRIRPVLEPATVAANEQLSAHIWLITLAAPYTAEHALPGQFVQLGLPAERDSVLRVPISIYAADAQSGQIQLMYQVLGPSTTLMTAMRPGEECDLIGPIGRGWTLPEEAPKRAILVGGGLGTAPITTLAERLAAAGCAVDVIIGAATSEALMARDRMGAAATRLVIATDDGTEGVHGFVTVPLADLLAEASADPYEYAAVCGPTPMMRNCVKQLVAAKVPTEVSMERLMACGVGACLSCVVPTTAGKRRACVDGPVFDAEEVCWDAC